MLSFLGWYFIVSILGWLTFPLAYRLFPSLADRGYSLSRAVGLLLWSYLFWSMASFGIAQNDIGGLILALAVVVGLSSWAFWKTTNPRPKTREVGKPILNWLKTHLRLITTIEILFLFSFAFLVIVRACNPEIVGTEKPMELAFINAILRSPTFPPRDPWLSGYAVSYYYFGYVMTAMLAKLTGTLGSVAFNLMLSLVFALSAVGAYGVLYNLFSTWRRTTDNGQQITDNRQTPVEDASRSSIVNRQLAFLGPLFLLLVSNLEGFLEILHRRGLFWKFNADGTATSSFWAWLNIKELTAPPNLPLGWTPDRFWWWWRASRVVQDFDLAGHWREIIDEFPFFSYLLGDLHPHVLAMPFGLLAAAAALNIFLDGWKGETNLFGVRLKINRVGFLFSAFVIGGLAFLNTWDAGAYLALISGAYILALVRGNGWRLTLVEDVVKFILPVGLLAFIFYLPFYIGFSSQAGGILPNLDSPTRGAHLWVMFGSLLLPILAYLIYLWRGEKRRTNWGLGIGLAAGLVLLLWGFSWLLGGIVYLHIPDLAQQYLALQGGLSLSTFFVTATTRRLLYTGGWLTLLVLLAFVLAFLFKTDGGRPTRSEAKGQSTGNGQSLNHRVAQSSNAHLHSSIPFVLLLICLGTLLVLAPEFVYLRDQFGNRMNTIFKFYYQAWLMWSLAAAFGVGVMFQNLRRVWNWLYRIGLVVLLVVALVYPIFGVLNKTNNFHPSFGWTLDGAAHLDQENPDDAAAIRWLQSAPDGIVAEAIIQNSSYTYYSRISTHTGLPTVLGWIGHEGQWRGGYIEQGSRLDDIKRLYETRSWTEAQAILSQYDIHYVVVGDLERSTYRLDERKFQQFLAPVFQSGNMVIYEAP